MKMRVQNKLMSENRNFLYLPCFDFKAGFRINNSISPSFYPVLSINPSVQPTLLVMALKANCSMVGEDTIENSSI